MCFIKFHQYTVVNIDAYPKQKDSLHSIKKGGLLATFEIVLHSDLFNS